MTDELKPVRCGCGGEAIVDYLIGEPSEGASYCVYCKACEMHTGYYDTEAEAIQAWNKAMSAKDINVPDKGDLINRQDVIHALEFSLENDYIDVTELLAFVNQLPSAEPEPKWIPVSEALPEEKGEYLVSYHPCHWDAVSEKVTVGIDTFRGKTTWAKKKYQKVIAWMPLPEPWRGEE